MSIEERKLKDNKISLRLAYYHGYEKIPDGKIKHHRNYEKLDLYLYGKALLILYSFMLKISLLTYFEDMLEI